MQINNISVARYHKFPSVSSSALAPSSEGLFENLRAPFGLGLALQNKCAVGFLSLAVQQKKCLASVTIPGFHTLINQSLHFHNKKVFSSDLFLLFACKSRFTVMAVVASAGCRKFEWLNGEREVVVVGVVDQEPMIHRLLGALGQVALCSEIDVCSIAIFSKLIMIFGNSQNVRFCTEMSFNSTNRHKNDISWCKNTEFKIFKKL